MVPPIVDRDCRLCEGEFEENNHVYKITIPVSEARSVTFLGP